VIDPVVGLLIVGGLMVLFLSASWHKWRALAEFEAVLVNYRLVPRPVAHVLRIAVPALELLLALALAYGPTRPAAAVAGGALLLVYAAAIAINLRRGRRDLDCGCAAWNERRPIAPWMIVRNIVLAGILAASLAPWTTRPLSAVDALTVAGGVVIATLLYAAIDRLLGQVVPRAAALKGQA
jgi:hypothetical protein